MILNKKSILATALFSTMCLLGAPKASADLFHFDINTAALIPDSADQLFSLDLTLVDGGTFTNTFTITNFVYTGGGATGSTGTVFGFGTATGNLASSVTMISGGGTGFLNDIYQNFTAATSDIKFDVNTTTVVGGTPDTFAVTLLDNAHNAIWTTAGDASTLASIEIDPTILAETFQSTTPTPSGVTASIVPEPASGTALVGGLGVLIGFWRRKVAVR